ncbi:MAG: hypothetical protein QME64_06335 [bacterium]|nr:hypothetical protein [bacterium]
MANISLEILDLLIAIEKEVSRLYFDFAMEYNSNPEQHSFWQNIAMEEIEHASFLESESQIISSISELQFVQFVNQQKIAEMLAEIKKYRAEFAQSPYSHEQAIQVALTMELGYNEHLLRHSLKTEFPELRKMLETLGSMNEKHIQLLSKYTAELREKKLNS